MKTMSYKDAGVDVDRADTLIGRMKKRIHDTFNPYVLSPIGSFAALAEIPTGYNHPVLVTATDGVGTKLKVAFASQKHDTVGIDLVAMSVNDVLTVGARPYFFLDYFACGTLDEQIYTEVIEGICAGCEIAGCALVGGETAEMPSFYAPGEYDLAGFVTAFAEKEKMIDGSRIEAGDRVIGLASSGLHSNGFSLARKILFEQHQLALKERADGLEGSLYEELLKPTKIYVKSILALMEKLEIKGMAHITGGGLTENIPRILPEGLGAILRRSTWTPPPVFEWLQTAGNIAAGEMHRTFNCGIGMVVIVAPQDAEATLACLREAGENAAVIGEIRALVDGAPATVVV